MTREQEFREDVIRLRAQNEQLTKERDALRAAIHDALVFTADTDVDGEGRAGNAQLCLAMALNRIDEQKERTK